MMVKSNREASVAAMIQQLKMQRVIAYPTEAVFGLGCDPDSQLAVEQLLVLKQRPWEKGLILIAANYQQLLPYIDDSVLSPQQRILVLASWPGPVTWVMPKQASTPNWLTGIFDSLAVRVSAHPLVQELCLAFNKPIVSTSANLVGYAPCRTEQEVRMQFGNELPILSGTVGGREKPSEIRDALTGELFRQG